MDNTDVRKMLSCLLPMICRLCEGRFDMDGFKGYLEYFGGWMAKKTTNMVGF
jgi:hypothetical protein